MTGMFSGDDKILRFVYIGAVRDAVRRRAYAGKKKWLEEDAAFQTVKGPLKRLVENVLAGKYTSQEDYDRDFDRSGGEICLPARYLSFQRDIRALAQAWGMTPLAYDYHCWPRDGGGRPPERKKT